LTPPAPKGHPGSAWHGNDRRLVTKLKAAFSWCYFRLKGYHSWRSWPLLGYHGMALETSIRGGAKEAGLACADPCSRGGNFANLIWFLAHWRLGSEHQPWGTAPTLDGVHTRVTHGLSIHCGLKGHSKEYSTALIDSLNWLNQCIEMSVEHHKSAQLELVQLQTYILN
jgi:hypothetical protein